MCGPILLGSIALLIGDFALLVEMGTRIGTMQTLLLAFVTASVGLWAARDQGVAAMARIRAGGVPNEGELLEGPLVAVAALLLLIPGFITDTMGALLLVPPIRRAAARGLARRFGGPPGGGGGGGQQIIVVRPKEPDEE